VYRSIVGPGSHLVVEEAQRMLREDEREAVALIEQHRHLVERVAEALLERETLDEEQFLQLVES